MMEIPTTPGPEQDGESLREGLHGVITILGEAVASNAPPTVEELPLNDEEVQLVEYIAELDRLRGVVESYLRQAGSPPSA